LRSFSSCHHVRNSSLFFLQDQGQTQPGIPGQGQHLPGAVQEELNPKAPAPPQVGGFAALYAGAEALPLSMSWYDFVAIDESAAQVVESFSRSKG
jgi:hypothetical protein